MADPLASRDRRFPFDPFISGLVVCLVVLMVSTTRRSMASLCNHARRTAARRMTPAIICCLLCFPVSALAADVDLASNTILSNEGYLVLTWQTTNAETDTDTLTLQQAVSADFANASALPVPLSGSHTVTGLPNGEYFFRVGTPAEGWSDTVTVTVIHHSLVQAWSFFALGLLLFMVLGGVIFAGTRNVRGNRQ